MKMKPIAPFVAIATCLVGVAPAQATHQIDYDGASKALPVGTEAGGVWPQANHPRTTPPHQRQAMARRAPSTGEDSPSFLHRRPLCPQGLVHDQDKQTSRACTGIATGPDPFDSCPGNGFAKAGKTGVALWSGGSFQDIVQRHRKMFEKSPNSPIGKDATDTGIEHLRPETELSCNTFAGQQ